MIVHQSCDEVRRRERARPPEGQEPQNVTILTDRVERSDRVRRTDVARDASGHHVDDP